MSTPQVYDKKCDNSKNDEETNTKEFNETLILFYKNDVLTEK